MSESFGLGARAGIPLVAVRQTERETDNHSVELALMTSRVRETDAFPANENTKNFAQLPQGGVVKLKTGALARAQTGAQGVRVLISFFFFLQLSRLPTEAFVSTPLQLTRQNQIQFTQ